MTLPVLVLTAGLGTRLDPLTRLVAKAAVPLGDRSLIERVLAWLRAQGARDVVLNLHHRPATITALVGDGAHLGLSVRYSWEQPLLGSAGGPRRALPLLGSDLMVIVNGDTLCEIDLAEMIADHVRTGADVTLALAPNEAPERYNGILLGADNDVVGFVGRGEAESSWHFVGVQVAHRRVFEGLADGVPSETIAGIYRTMVAESPGRIRGWRTNVPFMDVGTPRDYLEAALRWKTDAAGDAMPAGVSRSVIWSGVTIGAGVSLQDCVLIGGVAIPAGFRAASAVLAPAGIVRREDDVEIRDGVAVFGL